MAAVVVVYMDQAVVQALAVVVVAEVVMVVPV
jgi:hypothetical protein